MADAGHPAPDGPGTGQRLESWKEIAAYLRRDVRTVQRWEQLDGLPIHRHRRTQRSIPYAYTAELDAWWTSRSDAPPPLPPVAAAPPTGRRSRWLAVAALSLVTLTVAAVAWSLRSQPSTTAPATSATSAPPAAEATSVAVLPFTDLTEGMTHEEFADGVAEEIIVRLNAVPGYRVPAPASTFYFRNKDVTIQEISSILRVAFVVDGSVRRSGATVRVAARLIRAADAAVFWSDTYDRTWRDALSVQDDVAAAVAQAIVAAIGTSPAAN